MLTSTLSTTFAATMAPLINFALAQPQLYFTVQDHLKKALREGILSLSHRSNQFEKIFRETTENLKVLLSLPDDYHIYFMSSSLETMERVLQNLVRVKSTHLVSGAYSKRFYEMAGELNKPAHRIDVDIDKGLPENIVIPPDSDLIAISHTEPDNGVSIPVDYINKIKDQHPKALIAIDAASSLPYPSFDYFKIDSVFFSVQKCFGLPAGLGVWAVNEKCMDKASAMYQEGIPIGSYHNLLNLHHYAAKNQAPETPNVVGIYLLGKVVQDMLQRGLLAIRRETDYKAAILYQALNTHPLMKPLVKQRELQAKTIVVADCGDNASFIKQTLLSKGIQVSNGYGQNEQRHLRFANFTAHSKEQFELLVDTLNEIR